MSVTLTYYPYVKQIRQELLIVNGLIKNGLSFKSDTKFCFTLCITEKNY